MGELATLLSDIETTLAAAPSVLLTQNYDELTEGVSETPLLQVYPEGCDPVSRKSETDRITLGGTTGGVVQKIYTVNCDCYISQRHFIAQDMRDLVVAIDELMDILEAQPRGDLFGNSTVNSFKWSWKRVSFTYSGALFVGVKILLKVNVM